MDKKTVIAFILIGAILVLTQTNWYKKSVLGLKESDIKPRIQQDTTVVLSKNVENPILVDRDSLIQKETSLVENKLSTLPSIFKEVVSGKEQNIQVQTGKYNAIFSTQGATIKSWMLNDYFYKDDIPVQLIKNEGYGNLGIQFTVESDTFYTQNLIFTTNKEKIDLTSGMAQDDLVLELDLGDDRKIRKIYTFYSDKYDIDLRIELVNLEGLISDQKYTLTWLSGLNVPEQNVLEDVRNSKAYIFSGGEKEELSLPEKLNIRKETSDFEGKIDWVAIRSKYFASIVFPKINDDISVRLKGETYSLDKENVAKNYSAFLQMKIPNSERKNVIQDFQVYIGPLDYNIIKKYHSGFDKIMGYGPAIIRPFAKLTIKVFRFLHGFIPNYGLVLIIFSILVKVVVYPLTRKSYVAMREMQKLQPIMNELKEKHKNDPQKLNKEMMALYKEHGANPLSGCLPTLLQMPLLWAIFLVFRNTIQLRQAPFIFWITDLSSPDTIMLPFVLPLIGNSIHIIPLLMGITMFIQQKMTMKDPKQKAMVYFMPIFLTFIFYKFPSGLNLYYTLFNLFSMIQQRITPEKHEDEAEQRTSTIDKKSTKKK